VLIVQLALPACSGGARDGQGCHGSRAATGWSQPWRLPASPPPVSALNTGVRRARQVRVVAGELRSQVSERVSELAKLMGQHGDTTRDPDSLIFRVNPWARRPRRACAGRGVGGVGLPPAARVHPTACSACSGSVGSDRGSGHVQAHKLLLHLGTLAS